MVSELKPNPFRKPEERYEFFRKLVQSNPTKKWIRDVVSTSPAANPAGTVNQTLVDQTVQQEEQNDAQAKKFKER